MKKSVLSCLLIIVLTLATVVQSTTLALAQSPKEAMVQSVARPALMIKAPRTADISQPAAITVFEKHKHQPVAGVGVYALKADENASTADSSDYTAVIAHYASAGDMRAIHLGETDDRGALTYQFTNTGSYLLIAFRFGYAPDFSWMTVVLSAKQGLGIKASDSAEVGAPIAFKVVDRDTGKPVASAALYARKIGEISLPKVTSKVIINSSVKEIAAEVSAESELEYAAEIRSSGIFLGYTGDNGELTYTFDQSGRYILVALKDNYAPGLAKIAIALANRERLDVKAPRAAAVGRTVTITAVERTTRRPVGGASIYALKLRAIAAPTPIESGTDVRITIADPANLSESERYASLARQSGVLIDYTNSNGKVAHSFAEAGLYIVVSAKDSYMPGFARITVNPFKAGKPMEVEIVQPSSSNSTMATQQ